MKQGAKPPHFWTLRNGGWFLRGMFKLDPLPLDSPVYVTQREAAEYAVWKKKQLPTEAQYHRAAYASRDSVEREYPWGNDLPSPGQGAFDFVEWDPVAVFATPECDSDYGVAQLMGNGWEWGPPQYSSLSLVSDRSRITPGTRRTSLTVIIT